MNQNKELPGLSFLRGGPESSKGLEKGSSKCSNNGKYQTGRDITVPFTPINPILPHRRYRRRYSQH
jgi:hypothetical protein